MKKILIAILAAAAAGGAWYALSGEEAPQEIILSGNVDIRSVNTSFRVGGRLTELAADEGDRVKQGDILGRIDAEPYRIAVHQAEANAEIARAAIAAAEQQANAAQAELNLRLAGYRQEEIDQAKAALEAQIPVLENARKDFDRMKGLIAGGAVSQQMYDAAEKAYTSQLSTVEAARAKYDQMARGFRQEEIDLAKANFSAATVAVEEARARSRAADAQLEQARLNLADTEMPCPADGIVMTRTVEPGTMLQAGAPVLGISLRNPVWVRAYIDEPMLERVQPNMQVTVTTDSGSTFSGTVGFISPQAEFTPKTVETADIRTTLVYRLRIVVQDPQGRLNHGAPVSVHLPAQQ